MQVMADMTRRLQSAESAREQLWKENAKLREDNVTAHSRGAASIVQRSKATAAGSSGQGTQRAGLFSSSAADEEDVEAAQEGGSGGGLDSMNAALRRARLLIQRLPYVEACINHTRYDTLTATACASLCDMHRRTSACSVSGRISHNALLCCSCGCAGGGSPPRRSCLSRRCYHTSRHSRSRSRTSFSCTSGSTSSLVGVPLLPCSQLCPSGSLAYARSALKNDR